MKSVDIEKIEKDIDKIDRNLKADDKRFRKSIQLIHEDGSTFFIKNAFIMPYGDYIVVFSEHHGYMVYHKEDIYSYSQFEEKYTKEYNPLFGDNKVCECRHNYYRHFDTYDNMKDVGCKYCKCRTFREKHDKNV